MFKLLFYHDDIVFISGDLDNILKKLSLEKYQPIFEEQEVISLNLVIMFYYGASKQVCSKCLCHLQCVMLYKEVLTFTSADVP